MKYDKGKENLLRSYFHASLSSIEIGQLWPVLDIIPYNIPLLNLS